MNISLPNDKFLKGVYKHQIDFFKVFDSGKFKYHMLNWHRRARKTTTAINVLIREAFKNPKQVYTYIAPTLKQATNIIWEDPNMLFNYLPHHSLWTKSEKSLTIKLSNKSLIRLMGADKILDNARGVSSKGIVIDEFSVFANAEMFWQEIIRPIMMLQKDAWTIFTFTPKGQNYAYNLWRQADKIESFYKSRLTIDDTNLIGKDEKAELIRTERPNIIDQEYYCSFISDEDSVFITTKDIEKLKEANIINHSTKKVISCDVATGGDECVINVFHNTKIVEQKILHYKDTMKIVGELMLTGNRHKINNFVIDCIGVGKGVADRLNELGKYVIYFNSSESKNIPNLYHNKRAQAWWECSEKIRNFEITYPEDEETRRQLLDVRYKIQSSSGKILAETKADVKKRLGCSPDRADTFVMGIYALDYIDAENNYGRNADDDSYDFTARTC